MIDYKAEADKTLDRLTRVRVLLEQVLQEQHATAELLEGIVDAVEEWEHLLEDDLQDPLL